jgi:hypothetical protein
VVTPPPPPPPSGLDTAQEFRRICSKTNLATCAPVCDETTYGYLLSIEIDGRGTVMTCNKYDGIFSWQGQASLGGYIGSDFDSFFSAVISGAAGTYMATLTENRDVHTHLTCQPGQVVVVSGDEGLVVAPAWAWRQHRQMIWNIRCAPPAVRPSRRAPHGLHGTPLRAAQPMNSRARRPLSAPSSSPR